MNERSTGKPAGDLRSEVTHRFDLVDQKFPFVNEKFAAVDKRFDQVEGQVQGLRAETRTEFITLRGEIKGGFDAMNDRFDKMYRVLIGSAVAIALALVSAKDALAAAGDGASGGLASCRAWRADQVGFRVQR